MNDTKQTIKYLRPHEVAVILNVKVETLSQWRCSGKYDIEYIKVGRIILYPADKFYSWLESNAVNFNKS